MISGAASVSMSDAVVSCNVEDDAVILNLEDGEYHELNAVGADIWNKIQTPTTVDAIVAAMLEEYETDEETVRRDLDELLEEMRSKGLVRIDDPPGA
jgi:hypothetical protein